MLASRRSGAAAMGSVCPTALANAKPDAACPDGNDAECGIGTWRRAGTRAESRSGRRRRAASLKPMLTTAESTASATSPARRCAGPARPPTAAIATAIPSHSRDRSAALDSRRIGGSSTGVGVSATAVDRAVDLPEFGQRRSRLRPAESAAAAHGPTTGRRRAPPAAAWSAAVPDLLPSQPSPSRPVRSGAIRKPTTGRRRAGNRRVRHRAPAGTRLARKLGPAGCRSDGT